MVFVFLPLLPEECAFPAAFAVFGAGLLFLLVLRAAVGWALLVGIAAAAAVVMLCVWTQRGGADN